MPDTRMPLNRNNMKRVVQFLLAVLMVILGIVWAALFIYNTGKVLPQLIGTIVLVMAAAGIGVSIKRIKDKK